MMQNIGEGRVLEFLYWLSHRKRQTIDYQDKYSKLFLKVAYEHFIIFQTIPLSCGC